MEAEFTVNRVDKTHREESSEDYFDHDLILSHRWRGVIHAIETSRLGSGIGSTHKKAQKALNGFLYHSCLLCLFVANNPNTREDQDCGNAGSPGQVFTQQ